MSPRRCRANSAFRWSIRADYPDAPVLESASPKFLKQAQILPLSDAPDRLVLAVTDPLDEYSVRSLALLTGKPVEIRIATPSDIELAYEKLYGGQKSTISQIVNEIEAEELGSDEDVDRLRDLASEEPVIRLVNLLISRAVESRASDIHIEPFLNRLGVRFRVDGVLREGATPPVRLRSAIVSRIKIMAKLNIAERRLPQDGRIRIAIRGRDYDLRVATVPTLHGEGVTMRILDRTSLVEDFAVLGFAPDTLARYLELLERPQGILLVTGPTGSGKTTTLYTSLMRLNTPEKKIFTVEDPIEYQLEGVNQVQVKPQIKLTFVEILRALLRHNPDVIMIGEMRDFETAQIAIQAALTGHLVLSTLHTNNAASSITRLLDMKIEDYLVTSTVNGVHGAAPGAAAVRGLPPAAPGLARVLRAHGHDAAHAGARGDAATSRSAASTAIRAAIAARPRSSRCCRCRTRSGKWCCGTPKRARSIAPRSRKACARCTRTG